MSYSGPDPNEPRDAFGLPFSERYFIDHQAAIEERRREHVIYAARQRSETARRWRVSKPAVDSFLAELNGIEGDLGEIARLHSWNRSRDYHDCDGCPVDGEDGSNDWPCPTIEKICELRGIAIPDDLYLHAIYPEEPPVV